MKGLGRSIFLASRDWIRDDSKDADDKLRVILGNMFKDTTNYFHYHTKKEALDREQHVYDEFSNLSQFIEGMRDRGLSGSEVSRANSHLSKMVTAFEKMKHIFQYRTPRTLRVYSKFFIYLLPVLYAPYFAFISLEYSAGLEYIMPILFSVILVSLDNIQDHLENPYDQHGEDDVTFNGEKFADNL